MRPRGRGLARVAGLFVAAAAAACGGDQTGGGAPPEVGTPIRTMTVTATPEAERIRGSGVVTSRAELDLAFKVAGYVAEVRVDEGGRVEEGAVLARLRSEEVDAQVRAAEAQADLAHRQLQRMERLWADSVVTQAALDEVRHGNEGAQAALEIARFNQEYATIRAPADGRVLRRWVEVAEFAGPGMPAFRLGVTGSGWVVHLGVADRQMTRLSVGDSAEVVVPALDGLTLPGRIRSIGDAADPATGTFEVEVSVPDAGGRLRSGMVAGVTLVVSRPEEISLLPPHALVDADGDRAAVFVVEGGTVHQRPVRIVRVGAEWVGVTAPGLAGATVVTDGAAYLRDGESVDDRTAAFPVGR